MLCYLEKAVEKRRRKAIMKRYAFHANAIKTNTTYKVYYDCMGITLKEIFQTLFTENYYYKAITTQSNFSFIDLKTNKLRCCNKSVRCGGNFKILILFFTSEVKSCIVNMENMHIPIIRSMISLPARTCLFISHSTNHLKKISAFINPFALAYMYW